MAFELSCSLANCVGGRHNFYEKYKSVNSSWILKKVDPGTAAVKGVRIESIA